MAQKQQPLTQEWSFASMSPPSSSPPSAAAVAAAVSSSLLPDGTLASPFRVPNARPGSGDNHKRPSSAEAARQRSVERKTSGTTPGGSSTSTGIGNTAAIPSSSQSSASVTSNNSNNSVPGALSMTRSPSRDAAAQQQASMMSLGGGGGGGSVSGSGQLSSRDRSQSIDRAKTPERVRTPHTSREEPVTSPQYDSKLNASLRAYVFLGGSCDPTTWRRDVAVPLLERAKVPYYNPQIRDWHPGLIQAEAKAKEECSVLIFVIDGQTRAIASMLEATEHIFRKKEIVLVIEDVPESQIIEGESVGRRQQEDLNRARAFLCDIAARHQDNCDVFPSVEKAVLDVVYNYQSKHGLRRGSLSGSGGGHAALLQTKRPSLTNPMISTSSSPLTGSAPNLLINGPFSPSSPASPPIVLNSTVGMSPSSATASLGTPNPAIGGGGGIASAISQHSRTPSGTSHTNTSGYSHLNAHGNGHATRAQSSPIAIPSSSSSSSSSSASPSLSPSTT